MTWVSTSTLYVGTVDDGEHSDALGRRRRVMGDHSEQRDNEPASVLFPRRVAETSLLHHPRQVRNMTATPGSHQSGGEWTGITDSHDEEDPGMHYSHDGEESSAAPMLPLEIDIYNRNPLAVTTTATNSTIPSPLSMSGENEKSKRQPNNTANPNDDYNQEDDPGGSTDNEKLDKAFEDDDDVQPCLTEDIYSLMFTGSLTHGLPFGIFMFGLQWTIQLLIFFDLLALRSPDNVLQLPPGVELQVNVAQAIGLILTVIFMAAGGDFFKGLTQLVAGYDPSIVQSMSPHGRHCRWVMSGLCQCTVGIFMLVNLFVLLMQSTEVIGLCLNFAALHFISEIDDMAFVVASTGWLSKPLQTECRRVSDAPPLSAEQKHRIKRTMRIVMCILLLGLIVPCFILISWQWNGKYLCTRVHVQYGDAYAPAVAVFSGHMISQGFHPTDRVDARAVYVDVASKTLRLAYCAPEQAWVVSYVHSTSHCDYIFKSETTDTFDVTTLATSSKWLALNPETGNDAPVDWIYLTCHDCVTSESNSDEEGEANEACDAIKGLCMPGTMGLECQFSYPKCGLIDVDLRTVETVSRASGGYLFTEQQWIAVPRYNGSLENWTYSDWTDYEPLQINHHPVYFPRIPEFITGNKFGFIMYSGLRWVFFGREDDNHQFFNILEERTNLIDMFIFEVDNTGVTNMKGLSLWDNYRPFFYSEPMYYGTHSYTLEPLDLGWVHARPLIRELDAEELDEIIRNKTAMVSHSQFKDLSHWYADDAETTDARFICARCNSKSQCQNDGICEQWINYAGCKCQNYFDGPQCEYAFSCMKDGVGCLNNGTCDTIYDHCDCLSPFFGNVCQHGFNDTDTIMA